MEKFARHRLDTFFKNLYYSSYEIGKKMADVNGVLEFSIGIIIVIIFVSIIYQWMEKKKRESIRKKFRNFSESHRVSSRNLRAVPRVMVPDSLEVTLTFTEKEYFGLNANALDISLSGFSVKPDFPLRRLPLNILVKNTMVVTPINTFVVREMKTVRIDHQVDRRLLAFHIEKIDEDQFEKLKRFMSYLDEFMKKKDDESQSG
jgi:hypothetical protein